MTEGLLFPEVAPTPQQQIHEIERELKQRAIVYPRLVAAGKLTATRAAFQVRCLEVVLARLREIGDK